MPGWSGLVLGFLCLFGPAQAADSIETVQKAVSEWAKLRAETVRLETEWRWQRESLEASLAALTARIASLERERDTLKSSLTAEGTNSIQLAKENSTARDALAVIEQRLGDLTQRLKNVRPYLPPRLSLALELPYRSIEDTKLGPAERMQHVVTIFNRCSLFNKSISLGEEALSLEAGENPRLLEVIYWGLAYGYALDRSGGKAYYGHPGKDGWVWEARPEAVDEVTQLIEIHYERSDPEFVPVPVQIAEPFAPAQR